MDIETILIQSKLPEAEIDLLGACKEESIFSVLFGDFVKDLLQTLIVQILATTALVDQVLARAFNDPNKTLVEHLVELGC